MDELISFEKFRQLMLNYNEDLTEQEIAEAWESFVKATIVEVEHNEDRREE